MKQTIHTRLLLLVTICLLLSTVSTARADTPDNLDVVWARVAHDNTPIYTKQSAASAIVARYDFKHVLYIGGMEQNQGQRWYEVVWPFKGWLRSEDIWFVSGAYNPTSIPLVERLVMRLHIDLGNYPEASEAVFGKARTADYKVKGPGTSNLVCQTLTWQGLIIRYENSYKDPKQAWIAKASAGPGSRAHFGPVSVGAPASSLQILDASFTAQTNGELILEQGLHRFRFTVQDGRVATMGYVSGDGVFLPIP